MKRKFLLMTLAATSVISLTQIPAYAQKAAAQATTAVAGSGQKIPADPDVKTGKLSNGLTYYIRKNVEPRNRAVLYMALKAGSLMETDAQQGLAHFTEHMAFNGTKDFPKNELINYLQKAGVKFGADLNAYTSFDQTVYQLPIPTDSAELFHNGFKILANWAGHISMLGPDIDGERGVIIEEDRQRGKNAQSRIQEALLPVILHGSRYAQRIPIGKIDILQSFKHEEIRNFYRDWYRPNLQAVIAVGDFEVSDVEKLIKDNFGKLTNPAKPKPHATYDLPGNKEPIVKIVTDKEYPYNVAMAFIRQRHKATNNVDDIRRGMVIGMANAMLGARIAELKQKGTAPFVDAQANYGSYQGGLVPGVEAATVFAVAKNGGELAQGLQGIMAEFERMVQFGFTASELEVVKKQSEAGNEKANREKDKIASNTYVQAYLKNFMYGAPIISPDFRYDITKKLLNDITLEEINAAAKKMIDKENLTIIVQAPEKEKASLPTEAQLLAAIRDAGKGLKPYEDSKNTPQLLEKLPAAGKVTKTEKIESIGVTKLTFSNGVVVYLKPTDFKNDQILFSSFGEGGFSQAGDNELMAINYASNIPGDGIGELDIPTLRRFLAGTNVGVSAYLGELYQGFSGNASPQDLEVALQMVYVYATNPRKDTSAFKKNIEEYVIYMQNADDSPENVYEDTVNAVLTSNSPRRKRPSVAELGQIDLNRSFEFYKKRFADASGQTFVFVGNFDVAAITPMLEAFLGGLPATNKAEKFVDRGVRPLSGKTERIVKKGIEDKAQVKLYFYNEYNYTPENNIQLSALSDILEFKVLERLREKEGGVYSPNVGVGFEKYPYGNYSLSVSFSCAPANVDKLVNAVLDEIEKIKKTGATADDITKFKAEYRRALELNMRENNFWLGYLSGKIKNGEDPTSVLTANERLNQVTEASIKAAANTFLGNANYFKAALVPEK